MQQEEALMEELKKQIKSNNEGDQVILMVYVNEYVHIERLHSSISNLFMREIICKNIEKGPATTGKIYRDNPLMGSGDT